MFERRAGWWSRLETAGTLDSGAVPSAGEDSSEAAAASSRAGVDCSGILATSMATGAPTCPSAEETTSTSTTPLPTSNPLRGCSVIGVAGVKSENLFLKTPPMTHTTPSRALSTALTTSFVLSLTLTSPWLSILSRSSNSPFSSCSYRLVLICVGNQFRKVTR